MENKKKYEDKYEKARYVSNAFILMYFLTLKCTHSIKVFWNVQQFFHSLTKYFFLRMCSNFYVDCRIQIVLKNWIWLKFTIIDSHLMPDGDPTIVHKNTEKLFH